MKLLILVQQTMVSSMQFAELVQLIQKVHQQHMCLILLKVEQSAFTQGSFSSLSGIHECSGGL